MDIINTEFTEGQGFADDLCILTQGTDVNVMQQRMQAVLNQLVAKSREANLIFSPEKTVAMMFSPKRRKILTRLLIEGKKLDTLETTRYLGVTIDNMLSWTPHINQKIDQCSSLLRNITRKTSSYFGPKPKLMRWVYTGIIRPKFTYGALVWAVSYTHLTLPTIYSV